MRAVDKKNGLLLLGFRKQNRMTQTELGLIVGKDKREVSHWEKGDRTIPQSIINLLNKKYRIRLKNTGKLMRTEIKTIIKKPTIKDSLKNFFNLMNILR